MQINSVSGVNPSPQPFRDEARQQGVESGVRASADTAAPVAQASRDAVQAMDPKEQAAQLDDAVKKINETISSMNRDIGLEFSTDDDTKMRMVKLVDIESKEVLRQIPTEEVLNIAKAIDKLQGLLVREKA